MWVLTALSVLTLGQAGEAPLRVDEPTLRDLGGFRTLIVRGPWRFRAGDDAEWSRPELDDSGWPRAPLFDLLESVTSPGFHWMRAQIDLGADLVGQDLNLQLMPCASFEVWVDGTFKRRSGTMTPGPEAEDPPIRIVDPLIVPLRFDRAGVHHIAVRALVIRPEELRRAGFRAPVLVALDPTSNHDRSVARWRTSGRAVDFFAGVALAIALIHGFLFIFRRQKKANLYFALTALAGAGIAALDQSTRLDTRVSDYLRDAALFRVWIVLMGLAGLRFHYEVFEPKVPKWFWILGAVGSILMLAAPWTPIQVSYLYTTLCLVEQSRVLVRAILQRRPHAYIIGIGGVVLAICASLQMLPSIIDRPPFWTEIYLLGFGVFFISISIYLAKTFTESEREVEVKRELEGAYRELRDAQSQLLRSEKLASLGQLVAGVAHEINTPIGAIHSIHDSLSRSVEKLEEALARHPELAAQEPQVPRALGVIRDASKVIGTGSKRVAEIVKRLKSFARLDEAHLQRADIHEGLEDTLLLVQHHLGDRIRVVKEYGEVPPLTCYPGQLNQVFLNLLVNAAQAITGPGTITLRTRRTDSEVTIAVEDTGSGIDPEHLQRIFDPGFTTKGVKVGTGLGLAISHRIIADHHGHIEVTSELGKGSTFTIHLPTNLDAILSGERTPPASRP